MIQVNNQQLAEFNFLKDLDKCLEGTEYSIKRDIISKIKKTIKFKKWWWFDYTKTITVGSIVYVGTQTIWVDLLVDEFDKFYPIIGEDKLNPKYNIKLELKSKYYFW